MKKLLFAFLACLALAALAWFVGRPAYRHYKEMRSVAQAKNFMEKADYRSASLSARQALMANPSNIDATKIMAQLAEISRSPLLIHWRQRVAELEPSVTNKLLLATAAMRLQPPPFALASQTLEELASSATNDPAYHVTAAELALRQQKLPEAEARFARAAELQPDNELHKLNLAVLQLRSTNASVSDQARKTLEQLATSTNTGPAALRWLIGSALLKRDLGDAEKFSTTLLHDSRATLEDRLQHSAILKQSNPAEFASFLANLKSTVSSNAGQSHALSTWMIANDMADNAFSWLTNFPAKLRAEQPLPVALSECYIARRDWTGLDAYLQKENWAEMEFLRYAYLAHAAFSQQQTRAAESRWAMAVQKAGDRIGALTLLANMPYASKTAEAREELLWKIAQRHPTEKWALRELERQYAGRGNTSSLNKVYSTLSSYEPKNIYARNNFAATALLLGRNLPEAHQTASELYAAHPNEPVIASTYAFSLHLQGRTRPALAALEKLPADKLESPTVALYYAVLLKADGQTNKANHYLSCATNSITLPEEKALLIQTTSR